MEQQKQSQTGPNNPTTEVAAIADLDYVTVVGCSNPAFYVRARKGNRMMFINQGIRQLRQYPEGAPDYAIQRVFLIFARDYPRKLLDKLKKIVEVDYGASYREMTDIADLVSFIAARRSKKRLIKQLDIFSHGLVHGIEFGYDVGESWQIRYGLNQARMLAPLAFDDDATVFSYACRTGLGHDIGTKLDPGEDPRYEESLAQVMADAGDVEVRAFPRRSNYDETYGTREELIAAQKTLPKIAEYERKAEAYDQQMAAYRRRTLALGKGPMNEIPGEPPPKAPVRPYTARELELAKHMQVRDENENNSDIGLPLDSLGAINPVRSGSTPEGLPMGLRIFKPRSRA
ncbi:hypothetical protein [Burkholderia cepacia]|nr:hypothetical protein [Burkholderia cepacia]AIO29086.1 hypothetical protein DM41_6425 [Burkholderia cepacia ATCC 25416]MCA8465740.1 hypothetical protein [Burkholderia cepacia]MDN7765449.1 hypothetical protein [Burkholderia cepacia]QCY07119.1 hypothetical protein EJ998_29550 [Burkholderia cepacia ATCC 25416]SPU75539.1 Uncharacterised protein [Burkholderia cepacia]